MAKHILFEDSSSTGAGTAFDWSGGLGEITIAGTVGTYAGAAQVSPDEGTTWLAMKDVNGNDISFTAAGTAIFWQPTGVKIRVNNTTVTSSTITGSLFDDKV